MSAMDSPALALSPSVTFTISLLKLTSGGQIHSEFAFQGIVKSCKIFAVSPNGFIPHSASKGAESNSSGDVHRRLSKLESLFRYDKEIPEEKLEKPVVLSIAEKATGGNLRCADCRAKGYVSGNTMCLEDGGRGHLGRKWLRKIY